MNCAICGLQSSYNRVVIDTVDETELGAICPGCEAENFGRTLEDGDWTDEECVMCNHDGFYALPKWRAYTVEVEGRKIAKSDYSLEDPCPYLCDGHFTQLMGTDESRTPHARSSTL